MAIEMISMWKTSDGSLFPTDKEAILHESLSDYDTFMKKIFDECVEYTYNEGEDVIDQEKFKKSLLAKKEILLDILMKM